MTADIFLKRDRIEAVTTNRSFFGITTDEDEEPDIKLTPNWATLTLGGGGGEKSDGDIKLLDRPDEDGDSTVRVHLSGGQGGHFDGTRVRVDGPSGGAKFGATSVADPDIELRSRDGLLRLGGGAGSPEEELRSFGEIRLEEGTQDPRVFITADGEEPTGEQHGLKSTVFVTGGSGDGEVIPGEEGNSGEIRLKRAGEPFGYSTVVLNGHTGQIRLGNNTSSGHVRMHKEHAPPIPTIRLDASDAQAIIGGSLEGDVGEPGSAEFRDSAGDTTVELDAHTDLARGGAIVVSTHEGTETVSILGNHTTANGGAIRIANDEGDDRVDLESNPQDANGGIVRLTNESAVETVTLASGPASDAGATLTLRSDGGGTRISLDGTAGTDAGGLLFLSDSTSFPTVLVDGGDGRIRLGGTEQADATGAGSREPGTLSLDDGAGMMVDLAAEDGAVTLAHHDPNKGEIGLELRPEDGLFSVFDANGDPVFQIDTQNKTIKHARGYKQGVIGRGP